MTTSTTWQLSREAAERYEQVLVRTMLGPQDEFLLERAAVRRGDAVLDVGSGTGAATRAAARAAGREGQIVGVDLNAAMLEVAASLPTPDGVHIDWREPRAEQLPFAQSEFDVVLCTQTLQFVTDRAAAASEMHCVLRPGGTLALTVWAPLTENVYFATLIDAVETHLGEQGAAGLRAVFALSDEGELTSLLERTVWRGAAAETRQLDLPLPQLADLVPRHLSATPVHAAFAAAPAQRRSAIATQVAQRLHGSPASASAALPFRVRTVVARKTAHGRH